MTESFRLGVVGAGGITALHLDAATALPGVQVTAVCDIRFEAAQEAAVRHGARAYADHRQMFEETALDGVVITVPHSLHARITLDAAAAGLHVLVEKPMATTVADCRAMTEGCAQAGVRLAVGHVLHFLPSVREAERILRSGRLGEPVVITERRTADYAPGSRPDWFFDPQIAGGGIVMNVGTHSIDKAQWLAAAPVTGVTAQVWQKPGAAVEADSVGLLTLANGVRVALSVTGTGLPFHDETEVVCANGALRLSRSDGLWMFAGSEAQQVVRPDEDDIAAAFRDQLADFVDSCRTDREPAVDGAYGTSVVAAALAMYESDRKGSHVQVETAEQVAEVQA